MRLHYEGLAIAGFGLALFIASAARADTPRAPPATASPHVDSKVLEDEVHSLQTAIGQYQQQITVLNAEMAALQQQRNTQADQAAALAAQAQLMQGQGQMAQQAPPRQTYPPGQGPVAADRPPPKPAKP